MKRDTNAVLDKVLRRERNRKIRLYLGLALVVIFLGSVGAYSQFKMSENVNDTPPVQEN